MEAESSFRSMVELYTGLLLSLRLNNKPASKSLFGTTEPAYSFTVEQAVEALQHPQLNKDVGRPLSHSAAKRLLAAFCECHLLHDPSKRVYSSLLMRTRLQPTAKGLALAQRTCKERGIYCEELIKYFCSIYNSLDIVRLEREVNSRVVYSPSFISFLWSRMLGEKPNVHDESSKSDFTVSAPKIYNVVSDVNMLGEFDDDFEANPKQGLSPYYHKFFLHPASGATSQYFESTSGVRLFSRVSFKLRRDQHPQGDDSSSLRRIKNTVAFWDSSRMSYKMPLVVSGRALWQWLMDCTDCLSRHDAVKIIDSLIEAGYILRVKGDCLDNIFCEDDLPPHCSREAFYAISENGLSISSWSAESTALALSYPKFMVQVQAKARAPASACCDNASSSDTAVDPQVEGKPALGHTKLGSVEEFRLTLGVQSVIEEPGLRAVFREQLTKIHAEENILFCDEYERLKPLMRELEDGVIFEKDAKLLQVQLQQCSRELELIIKKFIVPGAPMELNISGREKVTFTDYLKHHAEVGDDFKIMAPITLHAFASAARIYRQTISTLSILLNQLLLDDKLASQFHHHYARPQIAGC